MARFTGGMSPALLACLVLLLVLGFPQLSKADIEDEHQLQQSLGEAEQREERATAGREDAPDDTVIDPLQSIRKTWKSRPVVSLDEPLDGFTSLKDLVAEKSPANMAILFVSNSEGCAALAKVFGTLAKGYWDDLERRRSVSTSKLFFFTANLTKGTSKNLFRDHRITKVPTLILIPLGTPYPTGEFPEEWVMDPTLGGTVPEMARWIESLAANGFKFNPNVLASGASTAAIVGNLASSIENWGFYLILFQVAVLFISNAYRFTTKNAWLGLSVGVYFFSISGCIFCFLRGSSPFGYSEQHGFLFIYPDRSGQFFLEGLAIGMINCAVSLVLILASEMNIGRDAVAEVEEWFDGFPPERNELEQRNPNNPLIRQTRTERLLKTAALCVGVAIVLTFNLLILFKRKAPWYRPFTW